MEDFLEKFRQPESTNNPYAKPCWPGNVITYSSS